MRSHSIYFLNNFSIYHAVVLAFVIMLYIIFLVLICLITGSLYLFTTILCLWLFFVFLVMAVVAGVR